MSVLVLSAQEIFKTGVRLFWILTVPRYTSDTHAIDSSLIFEPILCSDSFCY